MEYVRLDSADKELLRRVANETTALNERIDRRVLPVLERIAERLDHIDSRLNEAQTDEYSSFYTTATEA